MIGAAEQSRRPAAILGPVSAQIPDDARRLHLQVGWWCVAVFGLVGLVLEALHGFKVGAYLDVANSTRRHMLTLAHAHGTLLGLINLGFAWTCTQLDWRPAPRAWASRCLLAATFALPVGFALGGVFALAADPGLGIVLVPLGALCLVVSAALAAIEIRAAAGVSPGATPPDPAAEADE